MKDTTAYTKFISRLGTNEESDECYTPMGEVWPLFKFLDSTKTYYEATSTHSGSIIEAMTRSGYNCVGNEGKDFFDCSANDVYDGIITNPPYSKKDQFIEHCYDLGKPFALLLPVAAFQGQKRGKMFNDKGISALVLNRRIDFTGKNAPTFGVAWFMGNGLCEAGRLWFVDN